MHGADVNPKQRKKISCTAVRERTIWALAMRGFLKLLCFIGHASTTQMEECGVIGCRTAPIVGNDTVLSR